MSMNISSTILPRPARFQWLAKFWNWLTEPHASITDYGERRSARLASSFLLLITIFDLIGGFARIPRLGVVQAFSEAVGFSLVPLSLSYFLTRTKWYRAGIFLFAVSFSSLAYITMISQGKQADIGALILIYVPISLIVASTFLRAWGVVLLLVLNLAGFFLTTSYGIEFTPDNFGAQSGIIITIAVVLIVLSNFRNSVEKFRLDELKRINLELDGARVNLEQRVEERTKALNTSSEVSRRLSTILDQKQLVTEVVEQVQKAFNYYHAQIYLVDVANGDLVMAGGTGEAGQAMLAKGHRVEKGKGLVGRAAETKKASLVSDTSNDPVWLPNPLLPETKSEIAVPIMAGEQVLGVLDVQHNKVDGLGNQDADLLGSISSQVAIVLQNTQQYLENMRFKLGIEKSGDAVFATDVNGTIIYANPAFEKVYGYTPEEAVGNTPRIIKSGLLPQEQYEAFWGSLLSKAGVTGEIVNKRKDGRLVYIAGTNSAVVNGAGEIIGFLAIHHDITEQKQQQELTAQRIRQQEFLNTISQKIQSTTTVEAALQIAARELGHALGQKPTLVMLDPAVLASEQKTSATE